MSKKPTVSIITITYNHQEYIGKALQSFIQQNANFPFEVIVADDASQDKTADIIVDFQKRFPEIFKPILRKKNIGAVENVVDALQHAKGEFIAFCDGDDYWIDEHKLQKQVDFLRSHKDKVLCFSPTRVIYEDGKEDGQIWPTNAANRRHDIPSLISENFIPMNSVMYRRHDYSRLARDVMPFDWYLHLFHTRFGEIGFINDIMTIYRRHNGGMWWENRKNEAHHWKIYGQQTLNIINEVSKMYAGNKDLDVFINEAIEQAMVSIAKAHKQDVEAFGREVVAKFSDYALDSIVSLHQKAEKENEKIEALNQQVLKLQDDITRLNSANFRLKADVQNLRGSRIIGRIINTREMLGKVKKTNLALWAISRTKRGISRASPEFVKPLLSKTLLQPSRRVLKTIQGRNFEVQLQTPFERQFVKNSKWENSKPLVSVVVPYFNRADTIDETLDSLRKQTFQDFETILVNDGSTEESSIEKITEIRKKYPFVTIQNQTNQGVAQARNNGIKLATGKYIICLDSDDIIEPTYIEKCTVQLEYYQDSGLITTYKKDFGVSTEAYHIVPYNPLELYSNNMVITAAEFRKTAWEASGGYKSKIGYEDWEYWLSLAEHGFWGRLLPEELFNYRVAMASRFTEDKEIHWTNIKIIHDLHKNYKSSIRQIFNSKKKTEDLTTPETAFTNLSQSKQYKPLSKDKPHVLISLPWMTFGGAESHVLNFCKQLKTDFDISFITSLKSENEWEYKFREISKRYYHLANMFDEAAMQLEFISNYISTREINILHIVHHGVLFEMLPELRRRHPKLRVVVTMFNDIAEQFGRSAEYAEYIDVFTSEHSGVTSHYQRLVSESVLVRVVPNGIDCSDTFRLDLYNREAIRQELGLAKDDIAVFYVARYSVEKNPDIFVKVAGVANSGKLAKKTKFFMIGEGPLRPQIENHINHLKSNNIINLGYQSDVAHYLSAADVFVLPSSIEGFPVTVLEAMAMRVAVIASRVGAIDEVLESGKDGIVVTPGSVDEIRDALESIVENPRILTKMKSRGRQKVEEKYSVIQLGQNYARVYRDVQK